ncbi:hypothetical protein RRG08_056896 [Elysia crispata]|uniref:Uncharacterized protein n=1 Tax=Elysia crispata TaxID=231223 RepID=A0AAE1DET6_9GAST|nr:hypothetical protein RRG08_056896 [Elysia crispata]
MVSIDRRYGQYRLELCRTTAGGLKQHRMAGTGQGGHKISRGEKENRREKKREQADIRGPSPCLLLTPTSPLTTPAASAE